jgi:protein-tyrosine kinase
MSIPSEERRVHDHVGEALEQAAHGVARQQHASRSLARIVEPNPLPAKVLRERRLIHYHDSVRKHADAFREVRTRLIALGGERNFITMVTAVSPQSGASFVARNLAAAFALDDSKTSLLIDCNLRHPAQDTALGVDATNGGLVNFLDHPSLGIEKILYHTGIPRLRLIPSGTKREMGDEYFSSFRFRALLDSLRSRYPDRYLFLDGPAVKGSPDARMLADLADFVVLVVGHGRDTPTAINKAIGNFDPQKLAGVVFNETA